MGEIKHTIVHSRSQQLIDYACRYATEAHGDQKRNYTGEPYVVHPIAVAETVALYTPDVDVICAAFLHDVVEDTDRTLADIKKAFGYRTSVFVEEVTDIDKPEDGNRAFRKAMNRAHLAKASPQGQTIKLADLIDNTTSIIKYDRNFAKVYMKEKAELLKVLTKGEGHLQVIANAIVRSYYLEEGAG